MQARCVLVLLCLQDGKHEAIVKNIHDLLARLAWDFSPEQLDHLFGCFQVHVYMYSNYIFLYQTLPF